MQKRRIFELDHQVYKLVGGISKLALSDLFQPFVTLDDVPPNIKKKEKWVERTNNEIYRNKISAEKFLKESELFKLTGLNYEILVKEYKRIYKII